MNQRQPRILITRLSAVGDCVHTMPLVGELRRHYPQALIAWATQAGPATLLRDYPGLDEIIVVPRDYLKSWSTIQQVRRELRKFRFDVSLDPQSLTKSAALGWLSGAAQRIGFAKPQGREVSLLLNRTRVVPRTQHVVDRYLELLRPLVGDFVAQPKFELPAKRFRTVQGFLDDTPALSQGYAVINPGAGWDSKLWPAPRFGDVARHLGEQHQLPSVVVWAGDREHGWANEIMGCSGGHAWVAPPTTLPELASLMRGARMCLAGDTGPLHLAAAVGAPCIGLYGTTMPRVCGPYGPQHVAVQAYYQAGSSRERRRAPNDAMRAIEVSTVIQACETLLDRNRLSVTPTGLESKPALLAATPETHRRSA